MVKIQSGGGINSNKVVQSRSGVKVEPVSKAGNAAGVAQQGLATAFRKEPITQGQGYTPKVMPATCIANAVKGPPGTGPGGGGRTIYRSGSQSQTPVAKPMSAGRDTLAEYGPDSVTARGKR
jgi:hypothetical protein